MSFAINIRLPFALIICCALSLIARTVYAKEIAVKSEAINTYCGAIGANSPNTFRIGTGGSAGTYFPIGSLLATALSENCSKGSGGDNTLSKNDATNTQSLVAIAQRSTGSVSNVSDISNGLLEAALAQANVSYWAFHGKGPFEHQKSMRNLRGLATLYIESVHLVVKKDAPINTVFDLAGKRVSLDEIGSGTQLDMIPMLQAFGINVDSFNSVYLKTSDAIERLEADELDAFFLVAGYPVKAVENLVANGHARIVPIIGPPNNTINQDLPYFTVDEIPPNTYGNEEVIETLGVPAQLIISEHIDTDLVYNITKAIWSETTLTQLRQGHPKGSDVQLDSALKGMDIPLHSGALRFYHEQGMLEDE